MRKIALTVLFVGVLAVFIFICWFHTDPGAPSFESARGLTSSMPAYSNLSYQFLSPSPFEGGKMWLSTRSGTNQGHCFLYDIDQKHTLGELFKAEPVFMNRDQTALLCVQRRPQRTPLGQHLVQILERISGGKIRFAPVNDGEAFWVLDLRRNSATRIGSLSQFRGAGSNFQPSPGFRFGFNKPSASSQKPEFFVCDLERKSFRAVALDGWPDGWWSDTEIIIKDPANDFILFNVLTEKRSPLLSASRIAEFIETSKIPDADPKRAYLFSMWSGKHNDFYLTDTHKRWEATNSYLIKLERPDAALKLMAADFKFEWSDHFDSTASFYLYTGRQSGDRSTGVFLRDLRDNTSRTLVAPDDSKYFSLPQFYHDAVIYFRSNSLWWTDLNASNRTCLFPPRSTSR